MRAYLVAGFALVAGIFSAVVAWRLSADALALLIGVLVGIIILLPTNAILFFYLRAQSRSLNTRQQDMPAAPPVVIVQSAPPTLPYAPAQPSAQLPRWADSPLPPVRQPERVWSQRVVGAEDSMDAEIDDFWQLPTS